MSQHGEISIPELLSISKELVNTFFPSNDLYSLLVLSLVTITKYAKRHRHMSSQTRIDLAIMFLPDLVLYLKEINVINDEIVNELNKQIKARQDELALILQSYIYVSGGLRTKIDTKTPTTDHKRCDVI